MADNATPGQVDREAQLIATVEHDKIVFTWWIPLPDMEFVDARANRYTLRGCSMPVFPSTTLHVETRWQAFRRQLRFLWP